MPVSTLSELDSMGAALTAELEFCVSPRRRLSRNNSPPKHVLSRKCADWTGISDSIALETRHFPRMFLTFLVQVSHSRRLSKDFHR